MQPAIALIEFESIAIGVRAGDAMVKRAPVDVTYAGTVHPGKYLVLVGGDVACVEESYAAGLAAGGDTVLDRIFLPSAHPEVVRYLRGMRGRVTGEALGIVETRTVKAYCVFSGTVADVEAAVEIAVDRLEDPSTLVAQVVIPDFHDEMLANLEAATEFSARISGGRG